MVTLIASRSDHSYYLWSDRLTEICFSPNLKGPSQPPPFSMTSKLMIKHGEANSYCFAVSCVPEGMFNYLE